MTVARLSISLGGSLIVLILLLLVAIGCGILFYRTTTPPLPSGRRVILSILRSCVLALLLLLLFEPVVRLIRTDRREPEVAILLDDSESMALKDGEGDRAALVRAFLDGQRLSAISPAASLRYFPFSGKLNSHGTAVPESLDFRGELTDISQALADLKERIPQENIQAVILLTDGVSTAGRNPLYDAEALHIPVITVGVGDTTEQKDVLIENVLTNAVAYAETRVPVDVTVKSSGYDGENVEVTIGEGGEVLDRKVVKLQKGTHEYPVRLTIEPKNEGTKKYVVAVSKLPGELTDRNNSRSVFLKVLKSRLKVLLLAGPPNPDVAALRRILTEDRHLAVRALIQRRDGGFYEGTFARPLIDTADCVVLAGFPSVETPNGIVAQVAKFLEEGKKPVLFVNSRIIDYAKLRTLEPLLPFTWAGVSSTEILVFPSVPERQQTNPLVTLEGGMTLDGWQQLPPIFKTQSVFRAKPESDLIAAVKFQNVVTNEPLIVTRSIGREKSFAITGEGVWRWQLLAQDNVQTERFFPMLIDNAVRWLTTMDEGKNVRVTPVHESFTTAEPAAFTGQVYDSEYRPIDDAEITVEVNRGTERVPVALNAVGNGRYEGSIDGLAEGEYTFTAKATVAGKPYGEDRGRFSVGQLNVEFTQTRMNKALLEQIAYRTGGTYYDLANAESIAADLRSGVKLIPQDAIRASETELWNWKYMAGIMILLFAAEWFLRKRSGLL